MTDATTSGTAIDRTPCACGSGLRRRRCCGLDAAAQADPAGYAALDGLAQAMRKARSEGRAREAERHALALLDLAPLHRDGLRILFEIRRVERRLAAAEALAARLAALPPPEALWHIQHAQLLMAQGRHREAEAPARAALALAPRDAAAHHLMGIVLTETGQPFEGEHHYRTALGLLDGGNAAVAANLAWNLKLQGRLAEAASLYEAVLKDGKPGARVVAGAAQVFAALGDPDQAEALIETAQAPDDRMLGLLRSLLLLRRGDARGALERIEAVEREIAPQMLAASEFAAKGQALERLGRPVEALAAYRAGREYQQRLGRRFDARPLEARAAALREAFMAEKLAALPRPPPARPMPVFLLGVQRSGTSLLEQLLCQAPGVDPADGRAPLDDLARLLPKLVAGLGGPDLPYPAALPGMLAGSARESLPMLAGRYLAVLRERGVITGETRFVTDRSPGLPWTLGLANLLFPAAPVIHLLRHPLDVVLSGFAQDRLYEGGAGVTLESLARLYDIQMSMIGHFRGQMTLRYLPVRYEELEADPQGTLRRVLGFIGIDADPADLLAAPPRPVPRAPEHQLFQEPPHRRGLYRHRAFGPAFAEAMPLLDPWLERLGYRGAAREAA